MNINRQGQGKEILKKSFLFIGICTVLFVVFGLCLEWFFYRQCLNDGLLSGKKKYGLITNSYYATGNTPNFTFGACDSLFNAAELQIDSNSFASDIVIAIKKPEKTIRIMLAGASAMFGNVQNKTYVISDTYPESVYCYTSSIAGRLKQKLQHKYPGCRFEVINAAVSSHCLHQAWQMYIAKLHAFKPDIIVNMDGNNDAWAYFTGRNFEDPQVEYERKALTMLESKSDQSKFPYAVTYYRNWLEKNGRALLKEQEPHKSLAFNFDDYKKIEPQLIKNAQTTLWAISAYERQMQADSVFSIRVLQPLLLRKGKQKELSKLEKNFVQQLDKTMYLDSAALRLAKQNYGVLHEKITEVYKIGYGWFFDEYLSHAEDSIVTLYGSIFIDMNEKITGLKSSDEFFVDYCHLTPFGNDFLAKQLVPAIDMFMKRNAK